MRSMRGINRVVNKTRYGRHAYCVLLSGFAVGIDALFRPGIPWPAWAGAFVLFLLEAEGLLVLVGGRRRSGREATDAAGCAESFRMLAVAGATAAVLILVWGALAVAR